MFHRTAALCLLLLPLVLYLQLSLGSEEPLIGWRGETYNPEHDKAYYGEKSEVRAPRADKEQWDDDPSDYASNRGAFGEIILSWHPRVFYYPKFISHDECDHLIKSATPTLKKSVVFDKQGKLIVDAIRTSFGTFLRRLQDPIVRNVTTRASRLTHVPVSHQEDLQVLRYGQDQYYKAHVDSSKEKMTSPRRSTLLLYLSDVDEGGETSFPLTNVSDAFEQINGPFSQCAKGHVSLKPRKGDALFFYSLKEDGNLDPLSKHMGCPVKEGVKWTATIWTHTVPWRMEHFHEPTEDEKPDDPGVCEDFHEKCPKWVKENECDNNPIYMKGDGGEKLGHCRFSCGVCKICRVNDKLCYAWNRKQAGYLTLPELFEMDTWKEANVAYSKHTGIPIIVSLLSVALATAMLLQ